MELSPWKAPNCTLAVVTDILSQRDTFSREHNEKGGGGGLNANYRTAEAVAIVANQLGVTHGMLYGTDFVFKTAGDHIVLDFDSEFHRATAQDLLKKALIDAPPSGLSPWKGRCREITVATDRLSQREPFSREINATFGEGGGLNANYRTVEALAVAANRLGVCGGMLYGTDFVFKTAGDEIVLDFADNDRKRLGEPLLKDALVGQRPS